MVSESEPQVANRGDNIQHRNTKNQRFLLNLITPNFLWPRGENFPDQNTSDDRRQRTPSIPAIIYRPR